eukprot:m51a1_g6928 hypothetical protein (634) ;mRNA; f:178995-181710
MDTCVHCGHPISPFFGTPGGEEGLFDQPAPCARHAHRRGEPVTEILCVTEGCVPVACLCLYCLAEDHAGHTLCVAPAGASPALLAAAASAPAAAPASQEDSSSSSSSSNAVAVSSPESTAVVQGSPLAAQSPTAAVPSPQQVDTPTPALPPALEIESVFGLVAASWIPFTLDDQKTWMLAVESTAQIEQFSVQFRNHSGACVVRTHLYEAPRISEVTDVAVAQPREIAPGEPLVCFNAGVSHAVYRVSEASAPHVELAMRLTFSLTSDSRCCVRLETRCVAASASDGEAFPRSIFCQVGTCARGALPASKVQVLPGSEQKKKYCCGKGMMHQCLTCRKSLSAGNAADHRCKQRAASSAGWAAAEPKAKRRRYADLRALVVVLSLTCVVGSLAYFVPQYQHGHGGHDVVARRPVVPTAYPESSASSGYASTARAGPKLRRTPVGVSVELASSSLGSWYDVEVADDAPEKMLFHQNSQRSVSSSSANFVQPAASDTSALAGKSPATGAASSNAAAQADQPAKAAGSTVAAADASEAFDVVTLNAKLDTVQSASEEEPQAEQTSFRTPPASARRWEDSDDVLQAREWASACPPACAAACLVAAALAGALVCFLCMRFVLPGAARVHERDHTLLQSQ